MAELVAANAGVGATTVKAGGGLMDYATLLINGYLATEIVKRQNPVQTQYAEWGALSGADRTQTQQSTANNQTRQSVASGINPMMLFAGGVVVVGLILWLKK